MTGMLQPRERMDAKKKRHTTSNDPSKEYRLKTAEEKEVGIINKGGGMVNRRGILK
jgi:hypothetical protein